MGRPRVLAAPFVWPGHVAPLLRLCSYLAACGCDVTLLKAPDDDPEQQQQQQSKSRARRSVRWEGGVRIASSLPISPPSLPPAARSNDESENRSKLASVVAYLQSFQSMHVSELLHALPPLQGDSLLFSCVITDVYVDWAGALAAELGVPWIAFWTSTVAELLIYFEMPNLISRGVFPFAGPPSDDPILIPGLPPLHPEDYPSLGFVKEPKLRSLLHSYKDLVQKIPQASMVLVNSTYDLEQGPIDSLKSKGVNIVPVGPVHMLLERSELLKIADCQNGDMEEPGMKQSEIQSDMNLGMSDMKVCQSKADMKVQVGISEANTKAGKSEAEADMKVGKSEAESDMKVGKSEAEADMKVGKSEAEMKAGTSEADMKQLSEQKIVDWLDRQADSSVLYVSFGTTMPVVEGQFSELAAALEGSGRRYLWSVRAASLLPEGFEQRASAAGQLIVRFAPQLEVLHHRATAGFLTHCGWNSVLEAVDAGVPMVPLPISADQALTRSLLVRKWRFAISPVSAATAASDSSAASEASAASAGPAAPAASAAALPGRYVVARQQLGNAIAALFGEEGDVARREVLRAKECVRAAVQSGGSSWRGCQALLSLCGVTI